jgi:hypothetical protein
MIVLINFIHLINILYLQFDFYCTNWNIEGDVAHFHFILININRNDLNLIFTFLFTFLKITKKIKIIINKNLFQLWKWT